VQPAGQISDGASEGADEGGGMIAAITISCIGAACLLLLLVLWVSSFISLYINPDFFLWKNVKKNVKLSLYQAMKTHRVVRR
jgi:uncharacterized protein (DUF1919 family)